MRWLILLILCPFVLSDQYVVNSQDWQDIYSGMVYSGLTGNTGTFVINEGHGLLLQNQLSSSVKTIVIESVDRPHIRSYHLNLQASGVETDLRYAEQDLNLELAQEVDASGYIIMDDRYSYNAVSVAPYAVRKGYYVLFANNENIEEVENIVGDADVLLYGYVDREVSDALADNNPIIINKGDKFSNNLELLKIYLDEFGASQLVLTNGVFIEPQFFTPTSPVLFIGQSNVPDQTIDYLIDSPVKHAVVVGYDIFDNAVTLKNKAGLRIIIKFAKGIDSKQYALDMFNLPQPRYNIGISSVVYNQFNKKLEVSYFNTEDYPAFIKGSHNVLVDNSSVAVVGDDNALFIDSTETLTLTYDADLSDLDNMVVRSNLLYGEDRGALEYLDIIETRVETAQYEDNTAIDIKKVFYDKPTKRFHVLVVNTGEATVYVKPLLIDVIVNNREETLTTEAEAIEVGKKFLFKIKARLTPEDIADNEKIIVGVRYGRRQLSMVNYIERTFDFRAQTIAPTTLVIVGVLLAVAAAILFVVFRRRKENNRLGPAPRKR